MAWKKETQPWDNSKRKIYDTLKVRESSSEAIVVFLGEPRELKTTFGQSFTVDVGYLGGNSVKQVYVKKNEPKLIEPAQIGEIYGVWVTKTMIQALVNLFPEEEDVLEGKVVKIGRVYVTGGARGGYLGYTAELVDSHNEDMVANIIARYGEEPTEDVPEEKKVEVGNQDLEIGYQLIASAIDALGSMSYDQIDSFIAARKESGFIQTAVSAEDLANFCVSKNPDKYVVEIDGENRSLKVQ